MNLKTFTARSMGEALAAVRRHVGADAVILHTRTYHRGGILGLGSRQVVEVTAVDGQEYAKRRPAPARQRPGPSRPGRRAQTGSRQAARTIPEAPAGEEAPGAQGAAGDLIRRTYAAARAELERSAPPPAPAPGASAGEATSTDNAAGSGAAVGSTAAAPASAPRQAESDQLADEMRSMKRMVARMMSQQQQRRAEADMPQTLFDQYLALLEQEVAEELAGEVVGRVRQELDAGQLEDEQACRAAVMKAVAGLLPMDGVGPAAEAPRVARTEARPRTVALVGPTGVGKTTTIAKLAATFKLKQNKHVGLITMDTYRIAAVDQLKTYANIIGVPLHVVTAPSEMAAAVRQCQACDVVLIDTAGRSQRDDPRLEELRAFLEAADPHETHLVLSSTCTQRVLEDTIERFARIRTDRIIFTKLDEAVTLGVVLNVLRKVEKRLSYVTTGQEVPHQIEPGRADRLAALLLGEDAVAQGN